MKKNYIETYGQTLEVLFCQLNLHKNETHIYNIYIAKRDFVLFLFLYIE